MTREKSFETAQLD